MKDNQLEQILIQLTDHETRLKRLEGGASHAVAPRVATGGKQKTLREIIKGRKFKNGQEQIAVIVGYHEVMLNQPIQKDQIKEEWTRAKITNKFSAEFVARAKDTLIRVHPDDTCDLTQTGEEFLDRFLSNEPADATSK